ncbi:uncharacterized protein BDW43DRAFT_304175 [Aspergillus alliaceus]|uniref:uncharacterized protein n=1 Tax=Petromyces alliaceus TaxID=209559 RepID=UPI0012A626CC|nr:uncharacterized protein BDW43DRAFT_304175 [Aspergillus alliaceus]KAB8228038.1 hypothetical protein BDW43DRAFT_304175 [Aspergillus alliaceus]
MRAPTSANKYSEDILSDPMFQKIYAIGFPERTDKHDAITMGSSITGFDISWVDAVHPESIPLRARPPGIERLTPEEVGCWRAHMNIMQIIVANHVTTALIFEDDADWDILLKDQLSGFAYGAQAIQGQTGSAISPYGDAWDMLWLGHCGISSREDGQTFYVLPNDPTVRPDHHKDEFWAPSIASKPEVPASSRLVFHSSGGACTAAYAISYNGAQKILNALSMTQVTQPVDLAYQLMCKSRELPNFTCIAPYPQIISSWRPAGPSYRDSDIRTGDDTWHDAFSKGIVFSTMLNLKRIIAGESTVTAQWTDVQTREVRLNESGIIKGHLVSVEPDKMDK